MSLMWAGAAVACLIMAFMFGDEHKNKAGIAFLVCGAVAVILYDPVSRDPSHDGVPHHQGQRAL